MSTPWLKFFFWAYLLVIVWAAATALNPADPDLWHRLAVGEFLVKTGHFPEGDTFSYLADYQDIADHEWGSGLIFYGLWMADGGRAIVLTKIATLALTLTLVVWAGMGSRKPSFLLAGFYAIVMLALLPPFQSTVRCLVFTHIFFALWVFWWQRERRGYPVPTWLYPLTMIPWANLHGGFAIGLLWLAAVAMVDGTHEGPWRKWAVRFGICLAATLVNPYGWNLWIATGRALGTNREGFAEWAAVPLFSSPLQYPGYKLLLPGALAALIYAIYRRGWKNVDRPGAVLIGLFMILAVISARHTSLFAVVVGAILPGYMRERTTFSSMARPLRRLTYLTISAGLAAFPFFAAVCVLPNGAGLALEYPPVACPVDAVHFLQAGNTKGNLLVPFNYGSYALWQLRGKMRVSMDGRYDLVYKPATYRRVADFFAARGDWKSLLSAPRPDAILVPRSDPIYANLIAELAWKEAYQNETDAVFLPR